jgi:hypothetical protein
LEFGLIVDGASVEEELFVDEQTRIADSLEVCLAFGQKGVVIEVVADPAVS